MTAIKAILRLSFPATLAAIFAWAPAFAQIVPVSSRQLDALQIRLQKAEPALTEALAVLPATVVPPLSSRVAVSAPFAGTVLNTNVLIGQYVKEGEPLVTIASRDMLEAMARLRQSEVELQAAEVIAQRHQELFDRQVGSRIKAEETQTEVNKLRVATEQHRRIASLGNIRANADGSYTLIAPKAGHVVETRAAPGVSLETMAAAVLIDTSDELWVQVQLPAMFVKRIAQGDEIFISNAIVGRVISVGSSLDPLTRSATLLARLPEGSGLVAGQMLTVSVSKPAAPEALTVPTRSIARIDGRPMVFLRVGEGFAATPVSIRGKTVDVATIEGEIKAGQEVAVTGIAQLEKMLAGS